MFNDSSRFFYFREFSDGKREPIVENALIKKLDRNILEKLSLGIENFRVLFFDPDDGGLARRFTTLTARLQELLFLFHF